MADEEATEAVEDLLPQISAWLAIGFLEDASWARGNKGGLKMSEGLSRDDTDSLHQYSHKLTFPSHFGGGIRALFGVFIPKRPGGSVDQTGDTCGFGGWFLFEPSPSY